MLGLLVCGDNHFIMQGPKPDTAQAQSLVRHWWLIQIGGTTPSDLMPWTIQTRAFRESLEWAVVIGDDRKMTVAVAQLLGEMTARGIIATYFIET